jgi:hypothetical protein
MEGKLKFNEDGSVVMDQVEFLKNALFKISFVASNRKFSEDGEEISEREALDYIAMVAGDVLRYFK